MEDLRTASFLVNLQACIHDGTEQAEPPVEAYVEAAKNLHRLLGFFEEGRVYEVGDGYFPASADLLYGALSCAHSAFCSVYLIGSDPEPERRLYTPKIKLILRAPSAKDADSRTKEWQEEEEEEEEESKKRQG